MQYASELKPIDIQEIAQAARLARPYMYRISCHWTAGRYGQIYEDYHISIDKDGRIYCPYNCLDLTAYREHTYMRNSGCIGIALCGSYDAQFPAGGGSEPVTQAQIEVMSILIATLCKYADIYLNECKTHAEWASLDGYGAYSGDPETRWDLYLMPDSAQGGKLIAGGDVLRGKAAWYMDKV